MSDSPSDSPPESAPAAPSLTSPVIDCEPPAYPLDGPHTPSTLCPAPTTLHRHSTRRLRLVEAPTEHPPHAGAMQFAEMALRRVLEVLDRRRPVAQLRPLMRPLLVDAVVTQSQSRHDAAATLIRVRLRAVTEPAAAEVFATYHRGVRVRAIAARIEYCRGRWQLTALQIG
ncbi:Rv3235 family protein [Mycobacterium sp. 21AC1]|uniref:Rv3235 family protein n=1 Tax=[Mycobacterium] appelbergii TaxID=2939269 RepID=UPI0029391C75|nr:Rv3235 family protein [Mycobacterium sp. 21AC1]MDV3126841.1 Rv3235 family protein [Mycobacterium sp. 21AC1]